MEKQIYRGVSVDDGQLVEGTYSFVRYVGETHNIHWIETESGLKVTVIPYTLCRYTGYADCNGTKIFEFDEFREKGKKRVVGIIVQIRYKWVVSCDRVDYKGKLLSDIHSDIEITGNVHQHAGAAVQN